MAHIAVNTRLLLPGKMEGIGRFAYEVLKRMVERHPEHHFTFFFDRRYDSRFILGENVTAQVIYPQARHPLLWRFWFHYQLTRKLDRLKPDVFFSPEFYLSCSKNIPQVATFHDLAYEHFPEFIGRWAANYCQKFSPQYAQLASDILTVSEFSKADIIDQYQTEPEKISVVHNGSTEGFVPISPETQQNIRDQLTQGKPFIHFVGAIHPRKNIETLLLAFDHFKKTHPDSPLCLLIIGRKGWKYQGALNVFENMVHKSAVLFTGFVKDDMLQKLTASSEALVYVPVFEGFGIPLLEAMACETPIICSNVSSIPEVVGDAALQVSPKDFQGVSHAIEKVLFEKDRGLQLIEKGKIRVQKFSWDLSYQKVWDVINKYC